MTKAKIKRLIDVAREQGCRFVEVTEGAVNVRIPITPDKPVEIGGAANDNDDWSV
jgi:hypothetical protein